MTYFPLSIHEGYRSAVFSFLCCFLFWYQSNTDLIKWVGKSFLLFYFFGSVQLIFFKLIYFNWRLIILQYCSGFSHTLTWISHGCTCVPILNPPLNSIPIPSLRVVLVHQLWVPCLFIKLGLVIYFTYCNIHVLMLFSHIVPLSCSIGLYFCFCASTILSWWL